MAEQPPPAASTAADRDVEMSVAAAAQVSGPDDSHGDPDDDASYDAVTADLRETFEDNVILVYPTADEQPETDDDVAETEAISGPQCAKQEVVPRTPPPEAAQDKAADDSVEHAVAKKKKKQRHTSVAKAAFHIFKGNVGVGIFLLPMVYNDAGYIGSPVLGTLVGLLVVDATSMLVSTKRAIASEKVSSYPDVVRYVFGKPLQKAVNWMIVGTQLGFCLMYVQTAAGIFEEVWPFSGAYTTFVFIETLILVPLTFLTNNLSVLAVSSMLATVLVFFSVVATFFNAFIELEGSGVASTATAFGSFAKYPLFLASQLTVLEGVCVVLPVENSIKQEKKKDFQRMLLRTLALIVTMYAIYGNTGYLAFGSELTQSTVSVMPRGAFSTMVRLALAVNLLLTHPLQFCPAIQICDRALKVEPSHVNKDPRTVTMRVALNLLISAFALMVGPDALDLVLAFIGSLAATFIAVILPAVLHIRVMAAIKRRERRGAAQSPDEPWYMRLKVMLHDDGTNCSDPREARAICAEDPRLRPLSMKKVRCVAYTVFGMYVLVVGTTTCMYDAIEFFGRGKEKKKSESSSPPPSPTPTRVVGPVTSAPTPSPPTGKPFPTAQPSVTPKPGPG